MKPVISHAKNPLLTTVLFAELVSFDELQVEVVLNVGVVQLDERVSFHEEPLVHVQLVELSMVGTFHEEVVVELKVGTVQFTEDGNEVVDEVVEELLEDDETDGKSVLRIKLHSKLERVQSNELNSSLLSENQVMESLSDSLELEDDEVL